MKKEKKCNITDEEIQVVLDFVLEQFQLSVEQLELQKERIISYLVNKELVDPAVVLDKNMSELKEKVSLEIKELFPFKKNLEFKEKNSLETQEQFIFTKDDFYKAVTNIYENYIDDATGLLVDVVNYMKKYFPYDFSREEYLNIRVRKKGN